MFKIMMDTLRCTMFFNCDSQIVQLFLQAGADVNLKSEYGWTALHYAIGHASAEIVTLLLLQAGADVSLITDFGHTALHYATKGGKYKIIELLLINAKDKLTNKKYLDFVNTKENENGWTALHYAIGHASAEMDLIIASSWSRCEFDN